MDNAQQVQELLDTIKTRNAPDARVQLWRLSLEIINGRLALTGHTGVKGVFQQLSSVFPDLEDAHQFIDLEQTTKAIVCQQFVNVRRLPRHAAELITQFTYGWPVSMLLQEGEWSLVQQHYDGYIGWAKTDGFQVLSSAAFEALLQQPLTVNAHPHQLEQGETASPFEAVNLTVPTGSLVHDATSKFEAYHLAHQLEPVCKSMVRQFLHVPYLWGGVTTNGVDCSGLIQTIGKVLGLQVPRDADQQYALAKVDQPLEWNALPNYCLLFFTENGVRVTHVALHLTGGLYYHADGVVRLNHLDPQHQLFDAKRQSQWMGVGKWQQFPYLQPANLTQPFRYADL